MFFNLFYKYFINQHILCTQMSLKLEQFMLWTFNMLAQALEFGPRLILVSYHTDTRTFIFLTCTDSILWFLPNFTDNNKVDFWYQYHINMLFNLTSIYLIHEIPNTINLCCFLIFVIHNNMGISWPWFFIWK